MGMPWGSLLSGFGQVVEKKQDQEHQDKVERRRSLEKILGQVDPTTLDDRGREEYGRMIDDTYGDVVGGKGKDKKTPWGMLQRVVDHVRGQQSGSQPMSEQIPGGGTPTMPAGIPGSPVSAPVPPVPVGPQGALPQPVDPNSQLINRNPQPVMPQSDPRALHAQAPPAPSPGVDPKATGVDQGPAIPASLPPVPAPPMGAPQMGAPATGARPVAQGPGSLGDMLAHHVQDPWIKQFQHYQQMEDYKQKNIMAQIEARNQRGGKFTAVGITPGSALPTEQEDVYGRQIDPNQHYKIMQNMRGETEYFPTELPKLTAVAEKRQQAINDRMTTLGEDLPTATRNVAIQSFKDSQQKSIQDALRTTTMKLSQSEIASRTQKIQQQIADGKVDYKNAKTLMDWARATARAKKADKGAPMEVISADMDTLIDKELQQMGTSRAEILDAMRNKGGSVPTTPKTAPKKSSGGISVSLEKDGRITVNKP